MPVEKNPAGQKRGTQVAALSSSHTRPAIKSWRRINGIFSTVSAKRSQRRWTVGQRWQTRLRPLTCHFRPRNFCAASSGFGGWMRDFFSSFCGKRVNFLVLCQQAHAAVLRCFTGLRAQLQPSVRGLSCDQYHQVLPQQRFHHQLIHRSSSSRTISSYHSLVLPKTLSAERWMIINITQNFTACLHHATCYLWR